MPDQEVAPAAVVSESMTGNSTVTVQVLKVQVLKVQELTVQVLTVQELTAFSVASEKKQSRVNENAHASKQWQVESKHCPLSTVGSSICFPGTLHYHDVIQKFFLFYYQKCVLCFSIATIFD